MSTIHEKSTHSRNDTEYHRVFNYRDPQHTPYNKRPYEEKSLMTLKIDAHKRSQEWLQIRTEEFRTNERGDVREITHHLTLRTKQALALRDMLNEQFPL